MKFSKELAKWPSVLLQRNDNITKKIFIDGVPVIADFYGTNGNIEMLAAQKGDGSLVLRAWNLKNKVGAVGRIEGGGGVLEADILIPFICVKLDLGIALDFSRLNQVPVN